MTLADADIDFLRGVIADQTGHVVSPNQGYLLESRLQSVACSKGLDTLEALVAALRKGEDASIVTSVAEAMTINETFFFRDEHPFHALATRLVPRLLEKRQTTRHLQVWCAACSSGQEPYSVAMTLRERCPRLADWSIDILATDVCDSVLGRAKLGRYSAFEVERGVPVHVRDKYFRRAGAEWEVCDDIKKLVKFRKLNLTKPWSPIPKCDIVFMRNVLIYFSKETKQSILQRLRANLASDGYLLLGGGETLMNVDESYMRESIGQCVVYRP